MGSQPSAGDALGGLLIVDKQPEWTSHDVVAKVRRLAGTRKVGHGGTLDPMATGVLVVGIGRATKLLSYVAATDKTYRATVRLGQSTTTDDAEGETISVIPSGHLTDVDIEAAMSKWIGEVSQVPSAVSAIKVSGKRSYARVRSGEDVELPARPVVISEFVALGIQRGDDVVDVDVLVECSSGTYIRALARDVGNDLGVGGHLTALRRTRSGAFDESLATTLDKLERADTLPVLPLSEAVRELFAYRVLDQDESARVRHGGPVNLAGETSVVGAFDEAGSLLALMEPRNNELRVKVGFTG